MNTERLSFGRICFLAICGMIIYHFIKDVNFIGWDYEAYSKEDQAHLMYTGTLLCVMLPTIFGTFFGLGLRPIFFLSGGLFVLMPWIYIALKMWFMDSANDEMFWKMNSAELLGLQHAIDNGHKVQAEYDQRYAELRAEADRWRPIGGFLALGMGVFLFGLYSGVATAIDKILETLGID